MQPAVQWCNCKWYDENQVLLQSWLAFVNAACPMFEVAWKSLFILN